MTAERALRRSMAATVRWAGWGGLAGESADGHGGVADGCDFLPVVTIHDVVKAIEDLVEFSVDAVGGKGGDGIGEALEIGEENREVVGSAGFSVAVGLECVGDVAGENLAEGLARRFFSARSSRVRSATTASSSALRAAIMLCFSCSRAGAWREIVAWF